MCTSIQPSGTARSRGAVDAGTRSRSSGRAQLRAALFSECSRRKGRRRRTRCFEGFVQDVTERRRSARCASTSWRGDLRPEEERQRVARGSTTRPARRDRHPRRLKNVETAAGTEAEAMARDLRRLVAATLRDVGRIARGLRPSALDDLGLIPALQRYGDELGAARALAVHIHGDPTKRFPLPVETTLYRIIQEALTNAAAQRMPTASRRHPRTRRGQAVVQGRQRIRSRGGAGWRARHQPLGLTV